MLEPNSLANHDLAVSYDGRFVAVATFTAEVKIWEMKYGKEGGCSGGRGVAIDNNPRLGLDQQPQILP